MRPAPLLVALGVLVGCCKEPSPIAHSADVTPASPTPVNSASLGSGEATIAAPPPNANVLSLPFQSGKRVMVIQDDKTNLTHTGAGAKAVDFDVEEGTPLVACRAGIVLTALSHFDGNGLTPEWYNRANRVDIQHSDGTVAVYLHLKKGGVRVRVGQRVQEGEEIGLSGHTGFSAVPHLHLQLDRSPSSRVSLPMVFTLCDGAAARLVAGIVYEVPKTVSPTTISCVSNTDEQAAAGRGEVARLPFTLAKLLRPISNNEQAALAFRDHLRANRDRYHEEWIGLLRRSMQLDRKAQEELVFLDSQTPLDKRPEFARIFDPEEPYPPSEEGLALYHSIADISDLDK